MLYNLYDDFAADGLETFDSIGAETAYSLQDHAWNNLDPQLGALSPYDNFTSFDQGNPQYAKSRSFLAYDRDAHGFGLTLPSQPSFQLPVHQSETYLYQLGLNTIWHTDPEGYRHSRYVSPTDGISLSSSDSTFSDYALSPDVARGALAPTSFSPADIYPSPISESTSDRYISMYQERSRSVLQSTTPIMTSPTGCSMKEVLYTPDEDYNDAIMDDGADIQIKVQPPEEVELMDATSPRDSGLGQSVEDTSSIKDEEEYDTPKAETDNDSDFLPTRAARHAQSSPLRASLRTPRRPAPAMQDTTARITKKPKQTRKSSTRNTSSTAPSKSTPSSTTPSTTSSTKPKPLFPCPFHPFGCLSTFPNKNEWKRHTLSQHLQLGYYRCDLGSCNEGHSSGLTFRRGYNDFGRKDLFVQHVRRMHAAEHEGSTKDWGKMGKKEKERFEGWMELVRERCWRVRRAPPTWCVCGVCEKRFEDEEEEGRGRAWEERMEHVARHFEREGKMAKDEKVDEGLREWALEHGVITESGVLVGLAGEEAEEVSKGGKGSGGKGRSSRRGRRPGLRYGEDAGDVAMDVEEAEELDEDGDKIVVDVKHEAAVEDEVEEDTDAEGEDE